MFYGIVIRMFYQDHEPPHFHAEHRNQQAKFTFDGERLVGRIDSRAKLVSESGNGHWNIVENFWQTGST
jgi:hypothetical protein